MRDDKLLSNASLGTQLDTVMFNFDLPALKIDCSDAKHGEWLPYSLVFRYF